MTPKTKAELRLELRLRLQDAVAPYLFSDEELDGLINEAMREAGLRLRLEDKTSELCALLTVPGQSRYVISPLFFRVTRVAIDGRALRETSVRELDERARSIDSLGLPRAFFIDNDRSLNFYRAPDAEYSVRLEGYRYPRELVNDEDVCEIPPEFQSKMLLWAMKLAKQKEDPEVERQGAAVAHEAEFDREFGSKRSAYAIRKQSQYSRRTIRYGGL